MPNWCNNTLEIKSSDRDLLERYKAAIESGKLLELCRPQPDYETTDVFPTFPRDGNENTPVKKSEAWWDWCVQNWGTKWDIDTDQMSDVTIDGDELSVSFCTAWSPPVEALQFAAERDGFTFKLFYEESGVGFAGLATESEDDCREYDEIDEATRDAWAAQGFDLMDWEEYANE